MRTPGRRTWQAERRVWRVFSSPVCAATLLATAVACKSQQPRSSGFAAGVGVGSALAADGIVGRAWPNCTVIAGGQRTTADASGLFRLSHVPAVYDLTVIRPDVHTLYAQLVYQGLRRRDPQLVPAPTVHAPSGRTLDPRHRVARIGGIVSEGGPDPVEWDGADTMTGRLTAYRTNRGSGGYGTCDGSSYWFLEQALTVKSGETARVDLDLTCARTSHLLVNLALSNGYEAAYVWHTLRAKLRGGALVRQGVRRVRAASPRV